MIDKIGRLLEIWRNTSLTIERVDSSITNQTTISSSISSIATNSSAIIYNVSEVHLFGYHSTRLFPDRTDDYVQLVAGDTNNSYSNWSNIQTLNGSSFWELSKNGTIYIASFAVEDIGDLEERYIIEVAYGNSPDPTTNTISRHRISAASKGWLPSTQQMRVRTAPVPHNDTIWYRMMCSKANSTIRGYFRYFYSV